jgi:dephospho-CoA kinase
MERAREPQIFPESSKSIPKNPRPRVIGVTGGIGCGKTAFVSAMGRLGAKVIDADALAKRLVDLDFGVRAALISAFGNGAFDAEGRLKRKELADLVFSDAFKLKTLNEIVWPPLVNVIRAEIRQFENGESRAPVVVDMAVLFESGCEALFDAVIAVEAPLEKRIQWLSRSRGWDEKKIRMRMDAQMDVREKSNRADRVVTNDGDLRSLARKAEEALRALGWR